MITRQGTMLRLLSFRGASWFNLLLLDGARLAVPPRLYSLCKAELTDLFAAADYLPDIGKSVVSIFISSPLTLKQMRIFPKK